jgi:16S rRNA A1518/A1519 N6-dimethyltransferase RsmA/KsgA/DIM1 with predicted DNA glycosylase/AP lyase activity
LSQNFLRDPRLVMQREAAQRFLGEPGGTLVSALLHPWFAGQIRHHFRRSDFVPQPGVEVVLLNLSRRPQPLIPSASEAAYRDLVTYVDTAWQPTVQAALATALRTAACTRIERAAGIDLRRPPSALAGDEWEALAMAVHSDLPELPAAVQGAAARLEHQQASLKPRPRARSTG